MNEAGDEAAREPGPVARRRARSARHLRARLRRLAASAEEAAAKEGDDEPIQEADPAPAPRSPQEVLEDSVLGLAWAWILIPCVPLVAAVPLPFSLCGPLVPCVLGAWVFGCSRRRLTRYLGALTFILGALANMITLQPLLLKR
ncbi:MAG: hypothetical protein HYZ53_10620 [Planctomycetes bacterium]|nr:hypothetical protein [Planctomycetota bacterium]